MKIAKDIPSWVKNAFAWNKFVHQIDENKTALLHRSSNTNEEEDKHIYNEDGDEDDACDHNYINLQQDSIDNDDDGYDNESKPSGKHYEHYMDNNDSREEGNKLYKISCAGTYKSHNGQYENGDDNI